MGINYQPQLDNRISSINSMESSGVPTWYKSAGALARRGNLGKLCEPVMQTAHTWIPWETIQQRWWQHIEKAGFRTQTHTQIGLS